MRYCQGRVAIVTGAGRGIGREHALRLAAHGALVVVNDVGSAVDGSDAGDPSPAQQVVDEIAARYGEERAVADTSDVADFNGAEKLVATAVDTFGRLDVLVNNAGILRDRMLIKMTEEEWDAVIRVHLKGTFAPSHFAANHWRARVRAGDEVAGRIINTTSPSGLYGNVKQANYSAAKAGIAAFTLVTAMELARYGVTVNAVAPTALTRMTDSPLLLGWTEGDVREGLDPSHISSLVCWLASRLSDGVSGRVFDVNGHVLSVAESWRRGPSAAGPSDDPEALDGIVRGLLEQARPNPDLFGIDRQDRKVS